jgi:hypothetical protein
LVDPLENAPLPSRFDPDEIAVRRIEGDLIAGLEAPRLAMLRRQGDLTLAGDRRNDFCRPAEAPYN